MIVLQFSEMKNDITYTILIAFNSSSDIVYADCGCTAGHGQKCTCKHLASLCYFVKEFCHMTGAVNYSSATLSLQKWHQPRKRSSTPCTLNNIKFTKAIFGKNDKRVISTNYDPRPDHLRSTSIREVCQLRAEIEIKIPGIAMLNVLPASESTNHTTSTTLTTTSTGTEDFTFSLLPRPVPRTVKENIIEIIKNENHPISLPTLNKHSSLYLVMMTSKKLKKPQEHKVNRLDGTMNIIAE